MSWANLQPDPGAGTNSKPKTEPALELKPRPICDPISGCSSSYKKKVTTLVTSFWGVLRVIRGAVGGVLMFGGTYVGSFSTFRIFI